MASALKVLAFSDHRIGHRKQTQAVISALQRLTALSVADCSLPQLAGVRRLFHGLKAFWPLHRSTLVPSPRDVDLIIGSGSSTHLPMIALKRRCRARLVTCMAPDPLIRPWFDLCLIPRHDNPPDRGNILATFGPPCQQPDASRHDAQRGLILAGGVDPKSHRWNTSAFMAQIEALRARMPEISWTISSSPRTPEDTIAQLSRLASEKQKVSFFSAADTPPGWIESAYRIHSQVWVTADSVSMVYEALTAGCRVGILPVAWKRQDNKFQSGIDDLKNNGLVLDYDQWQSGRPWPAVPTPLNEARRCALEILNRWWPERLL